MNKKKIVVLIILCVLVLLISRIISKKEYEMSNVAVNTVGIERTESNFKIKKLLIVNVREKTLQTMDFENNLYVVSVKDEDMSKFKRGQEVEVYFDGIIDTSYPAGIRADKIEILNEDSNIEIPTEVLRNYSYSQNNISVQIKEFSNKNIVFEIIDSNEIPLEYGNNYEYAILKKNVENEEYNDSLEIDYNAVTPGVTTDTYSTTSSYSPDSSRLKKVWEEIEIIGNEDYKTCEWKINSEATMILEGISDWTNVYGELNYGEYDLQVLRKTSENDSFFRKISINFVIDKDGRLTYNEPKFEW